MRQSRVIQRAFSGGELAPELFARFDDAKFQTGAASLRNFVPKAAGSISRRPGTMFVRQAKAGTRVRLISYAYSLSQTLVIEAGRYTPSGYPEVGYFRFHSQGATVLYNQPANYAAPVSVSSIATGTGIITTSAGHGLSTGDPVVVFGFPNPSTAVNDRASLSGGYVQGPINGSAAMLEGTAVFFYPEPGATLPSEITAFKTYYIRNVSFTQYNLSESPQGDLISFGTSTGTIHACISFSSAVGMQQVFYAVVTGGTTLKLATTAANAIAGTAFTTLPSSGFGLFKIAKHYTPGDLVYLTSSMSVRPGVYYCVKAPCDVGSLMNEPSDYQGHQPVQIGATYWLPISGTVGENVSWVSATNKVTWAAHGLSNGTPVSFIPTGAATLGSLVAGTVYYVLNATTNDFQLSLTPFGSVVSTGTSTLFPNALANGFYEVPHFYTVDELFAAATAQSNDVLTIATPLHPAAELRRYASTRWTLQEVTFLPTLTQPATPSYVVTLGEGMTVTATSNTGPLTTATPHRFLGGDSVIASGLSGQNIPDGNYLVEGSVSPGTNTLKLVTTAGGLAVLPNTGSSLAGTLRLASSSSDAVNTYVMTAISASGDESLASPQINITNNLSVAGASNKIQWSATVGAVRYRVYRKSSGLFGFIGETDALSFTDDNITPDLSVTAPVFDQSLYHRSQVRFSTTNNYVLLTGHGLVAGAPVVFDTKDQLPTALTENVTYYVLNPNADAFQISATPGGTAISLTGEASNSGVTGYGAVHFARYGYFPSAVTYFEQRRFFAGSLVLPQDIWGTASGTESTLTYSLPVVDSDRIYVRIGSNLASSVRHLVSMGQLVALTSAIEYRLSPLNGDALTPMTVGARPQGYVGTAAVQPSIVGAQVVFAAARGGHVHALSYDYQIVGFRPVDLSLRATHLFEGLTIVQQAQQKAPQSVVWFVSSNGVLLSLTYSPEEEVSAWAHHDSGTGLFESVAVVSEDGEDRVYVSVNRSGTRFIERFAPFLQPAALADVIRCDCAVTFTATPATKTVVGLSHLEGKTVTILADGLVQASKVVTGGQITLDTAASKVQVGLAYTADLLTLPIYMQLPAAASGSSKGVNAIWIRVVNSGTFSAGPTLPTLAAANNPAAGATLTDLFQVTLPPSWSAEGQLYVRQVDPLPLTITGLTIELAVGN